MVRTAYGSELLQIAALVNRKFSTCMGITQHILGRNARVFSHFVQKIYIGVLIECGAPFRWNEVLDLWTENL